MEYLQEQSLDFNKPELNCESIWKYIRNLISAIEYCHEIAEIVHNKIDYDSIFIDGNNLLRISNFSSAKFINKNKFIKRDRIKFKLIPPELSKNNNEFYEGKAYDIWLIGTCLFQMTFKKPFDNNPNW